MLFVAGGVVGLVAGLVTRGRLRNVVGHRLSWPLVVVLAFVVRVVDRRTPLADTGLAPVLLVTSLSILAAWSVWHWDRLPGMWLVTAGIAMNLAVVLANGGRMPVDPSMLDRGPPALAAQGYWSEYVVAGPDTRLHWLSDLIPMPGPLGWLFPQAYSLGDMVTLVGMAVVLFLATRPAAVASPAKAITAP